MCSSKFFEKNSLKGSKEEIQSALLAAPNSLKRTLTKMSKPGLRVSMLSHLNLRFSISKSHYNHLIRTCTMTSRLSRDWFLIYVWKKREGSLRHFWNSINRALDRVL
jgi:hypothetical protein